MTALALFLLAMFLLVGWLLCLVYRETEQDFPPTHRCHRHCSAGQDGRLLEAFQMQNRVGNAACRRDGHILIPVFDIKTEIGA
jgi:hypothetical protein